MINVADNVCPRHSSHVVDTPKHCGADDYTAQQRQQQSCHESNPEGADDEPLHVPERAGILTDKKIFAVCEAIAVRAHLTKLAVKKQTQRRRSQYRGPGLDIADHLVSVAVL